MRATARLSGLTDTRIWILVTVIVTVLTLITLVVELPNKLKTLYETVLATKPQLDIKAIPLGQGTIMVDPLETIRGGKWHHLAWQPAYEIHNRGRQSTTIEDIIARFSPGPIQAEAYGRHFTIELVQLPEDQRCYTEYKTIGDFVDHHGMPMQQFPLTLRAGDKTYVELLVTLQIKVDGKPLSSDKKDVLYKFALGALAITKLRPDGSLPLIRQTFRTTTICQGGISVEHEHRDIFLMFEGAEKNAQEAFRKLLRTEEAKDEKQKGP